MFSRFRRIGMVVWNSAFTPHGRKNIANRFRMLIARRSREWQRGEPMPFRLKDGTVFVVHQGNSLSELIYNEGAYEPLETKLVREIITDSDVFVDIGANIGFFTAVASKAAGVSGEVHSFEPGKKTFEALRKSIHSLGLSNIIPNEMAVSDEHGTIEFWVSLSGGDAQQSIKDVSGLHGESQAISVQAITLDRYIGAWEPSKRVRLKLIKCDVEGAELRVLKGSQAILHGTDPPIWLIEHNRSALTQHGYSSENLCRQFEGYALYFIPLSWPPSTALVDKAQLVRDPSFLPDECNLLAIPKEGRHAAWLERLTTSKMIA